MIARPDQAATIRDSTSVQKVSFLSVDGLVPLKAGRNQEVDIICALLNAKKNMGDASGIQHSSVH